MVHADLGDAEMIMHVKSGTISAVRIGVAISLLLGGALSHRAVADSAPRPNVIIIFSDDQGTLDLNCYGSKDLHTPHLDSLARRGVRLTQFYAGSSVCSPSRAALLTGRYPHRAGVPNNTESRPELAGKKAHMPAEEVTIAEMLKAAGYRTGQLGKWHLGYEVGPNDQGFDESVGFLGGCIDKWSHFNYGGVSWGSAPKRHDWYRNGQEVWASGTHSGDLIVRDAIRFMETKSSSPFFMYVAFGSPHYPMQPYDRYRQHYKNLPEPRRAYAALVSTLDEQVGRLLAKVDELGLRDKTLIIFQSDQGHSTEARANYGGGNAGPYRGAKGSLFEGGIRVPAIVSMPGRLPQGEVREQLCTGCDWLPTIAAVCDAKLPSRNIDGRNLLPVIRSADTDSPHQVWHWQLGGQWAVREGDWKLIVNARDTTDGHKRHTRLAGPFLANLARDRAERTNFASEHPEVVTRLAKLHDEWLSQVHGN